MKTMKYGHKELWLFSLPTIFASVLEPLSGVVDTALVGNLSTLWLASLSLCVVLINSFTWIFNFLVHTSTQGVSDALGLNNSSLVSKRIKIALLSALGIGVLTSLILYIFRFSLFSLISTDQSIFPLADKYFSVRLLGHPFSVLNITLISILRGFEKTKESFFIMALTTGLNILLSYLFLFPLKMGIEGAAYGTVLSNIIGFCLSLLILFKEQRYSFIKSKLENQHWFYFGKNSLNMFGRSATLTFCFFLASKTAASLSTDALASHQVILQLWLFCSFFLDGVAITGNIIGAKLFAQKQYSFLKRLCTKLLLMGGLIGLFFTITFWLGRDYVIGIFSDDLKIIELCLKVWPWIFLSQIPSSLAFVYDGLIFGLGGFSFLRKHMLIGAFCLFLPIIFFTNIYDNIHFIWASLVVLNLYRALSGAYFVKVSVFSKKESI